MHLFCSISGAFCGSCTTLEQLSQCIYKRARQLDMQLSPPAYEISMVICWHTNTYSADVPCHTFVCMCVGCCSGREALCCSSKRAQCSCCGSSSSQQSTCQAAFGPTGTFQRPCCSPCQRGQQSHCTPIVTGPNSLCYPCRLVPDLMLLLVLCIRAETMHNGLFLDPAHMGNSHFIAILGLGSPLMP